MRANQSRPAFWPGLILVTVGVGLLARELGWLPAHVRALDFWPMFVVLIGLSVLLRGGGFFGALLGLSFVAVGALLLAGNLGFIAASVTRFWPALLVLVGIAVLFRRSREQPPDPPPPAASDRLSGDDSSYGRGELNQTMDEDRLVRHYICSGAQLQIESQAWKGGELAVTAGGVELDLRQAQLDPDGATLSLRVLMGGVEIRVPDTWQVQCDVMPLFGGADNSTRSTQGAGNAPRLRITGNVTLGGVNVEN